MPSQYGMIQEPTVPPAPLLCPGSSLLAVLPMMRSEPALSGATGGGARASRAHRGWGCPGSVSPPPPELRLLAPPGPTGAASRRFIATRAQSQLPAIARGGRQR